MHQLKFDILLQNQQLLAEKIVEAQYARQPQIWKPYEHLGRKKSVRDVGYHLLYLKEALEANDPNLFTEYLVWVKSLFENLGFPANTLTETLVCTRQVLSEALPAEYQQPALEMLDHGANYLGSAQVSPAAFIEPDNRLARQFLDFLLQGNRQAASQLILDEVRAGTPVKEIYLKAFQPSQREVGRLWQINQINVAQEHFCTAATQTIMAQLYPYLFNGQRKKYRLVMTCVGGELHEIGARMVADFFEMEGWDTYYLGANTPTHDILQTVKQYNAELLGISVTMTFHLPQAREIIAKIRAESPETRILVGGYPFNVSPHLWQQMNADGSAADAEEAIKIADRLCA